MGDTFEDEDLLNCYLYFRSYSQLITCSNDKPIDPNKKIDMPIIGEELSYTDGWIRDDFEIFR